MPPQMSREWAWAAMLVLTLSTCACAQQKQKDDIRKIMKDQKNKKDAAPAVGSNAPNFKLKTMAGDKEVELASFKGKKPVVLVFGSYT